MILYAVLVPAVDAMRPLRAPDLGLAYLTLGADALGQVWCLVSIHKEACRAEAVRICPPAGRVVKVECDGWPTAADLLQTVNKGSRIGA